MKWLHADYLLVFNPNWILPGVGNNNGSSTQPNTKQSSIRYVLILTQVLFMAQLFSTNAFSANTFSLNVLLSFTAIISQSIVNTNNFSHNYIKKNKYLENDIEFIKIKPTV